MSQVVLRYWSVVCSEWPCSTADMGVEEDAKQHILRSITFALGKGTHPES